LFRVWLHCIPVDAESRDPICAEISGSLVRRSQAADDLESILRKHPELQLNDALLSLVRSKTLKKKFRSYFKASLIGMASCFQITLKYMNEDIVQADERIHLVSKFKLGNF
jgi:hypothetical protein